MRNYLLTFVYNIYFLQYYKADKFIYIYIYTSALRLLALGHFVSAGGALWAPVVTLINYKGDNISKYVCHNAICHAKNKLSTSGSFFNQFVTYIYIYTNINRVLIVRIYLPVKKNCSKSMYTV